MCCLGFLRETGGLASVYTGRRARTIPWDFPAGVLRNSGCSAEKTQALLVTGDRFPLPQVILLLAQVRVPGRDLESPFPGMSRGPEGQQGATRICAQSSGWQRRFGGTFSESSRARLRRTREARDAMGGELLPLAPLLPVLPLYIFQLPRGIHFGKCHLHFLFGHVQVKVFLPVLTDVCA